MHAEKVNAMGDCFCVYFSERTTATSARQAYASLMQEKGRRMQDRMIPLYNRSSPYLQYLLVVDFLRLVQVNCLPLTHCQALSAVNSLSELFSEPCSRYGTGSLASIKHPDPRPTKLEVPAVPGPQQPGEKARRPKTKSHKLCRFPSSIDLRHTAGRHAAILFIYLQPLVSRARIAARSYALSTFQTPASLLTAGLS
jgi:hypothetical protein